MSTGHVGSLSIIITFMWTRVVFMRPGWPERCNHLAPVTRSPLPRLSLTVLPSSHQLCWVEIRVLPSWYTVSKQIHTNGTAARSKCRWKSTTWFQLKLKQILVRVNRMLFSFPRFFHSRGFITHVLFCFLCPLSFFPHSTPLLRNMGEIFLIMTLAHSIQG